jgi:uncharacterized protein YdhG (YjbR/CyaY superfamily)
MKGDKPAYHTIDEYIGLFPAETQKILQELRAVIHAAAPGAVEKISYQMPAFALKGNLVYFAAWKDHIGFYPTSSGTQAFQQELSAYETSKGTVKFPIDQPLPLDLVSRIVKFRVEENLKKAACKGK